MRSSKSVAAPSIVVLATFTALIMPTLSRAQAQSVHGVDLSYRDTTCAPCRD
jgi:hypothetical protein